MTEKEPMGPKGDNALTAQLNECFRKLSTLIDGVKNIQEKLNDGAFNVENKETNLKNYSKLTAEIENKNNPILSELGLQIFIDQGNKHADLNPDLEPWKTANVLIEDSKLFLSFLNKIPSNFIKEKEVSLLNKIIDDFTDTTGKKYDTETIDNKLFELLSASDKIISEYKRLNGNSGLLTDNINKFSNFIDALKGSYVKEYGLANYFGLLESNIYNSECEPEELIAYPDDYSKFLDINLETIKNVLKNKFFKEKYYTQIIEIFNHKLDRDEKLVKEGLENEKIESNKLIFTKALRSISESREKLKSI